MNEPAVNLSLTPEQIAKEYEEFAYIVSHDLNAPLRHIKEFTRLLVSGRQDNFTPEELDYINFLEKSIQKINDMQTALLTFSRLNTQPSPYKAIDCNALVHDILKEYQEDIDAFPTEVKCSDLPSVTGDPKQMRMLFKYLIDNAIKFHHNTRDKIISISSTSGKDMYYFEIKDNGIGIEDVHYNNIFKLFYKLHPELYPGIGAGLTIARKIVQRHGGEITIESKPHIGSSLLFSLPKKPQTPPPMGK